MNINNLMAVIGIFFGYTLLVFGLSALFLSPVLKGKSFLAAFQACFVMGNFYVMNVIFILLLFFHCSNRFITAVVLLLGAVLIRIFFLKRQNKDVLREFRHKVYRLFQGTYGWHLFWRQTGRRLYWRVRLGLRFMKGHLAEGLGILLCLGIQAYYVGMRFVLYSGYGGYDEVVHGAWVQHMMNGEIYSSGVYPFGYHEMAYAVAKLFHYHATQTVTMLGVVIMIYMTLMLYCLVVGVLKNSPAAFFAAFLYAGVNIFRQEAWQRCGYGFPQEFGAVFLYPMVLFFYWYMREKKRFHLVFFGLAFALTLYVHYYVTIIALLFCLAAGIVYLVYMFRNKLLAPILICGVAAFAVGASTMALGVATGHRLQGSLYWALEYIGLSEKEEEIEEENQEDIQNTGSDATGQTSSDLGTRDSVNMPDVNNSGGAASGEVSDTDGSSGEFSETAAGSESAEAASGGAAVSQGGNQEVQENTPLLKRLAALPGKIGRIFVTIYKYLCYYCVTPNAMLLYLICMVFSLVMACVYLFQRETVQGMFFLTILLYTFLLAIFVCAARLELPVIIGAERVRTFFCYVLPFFLAVPVAFAADRIEEFLLDEEEGDEDEDQTVSTAAGLKNRQNIIFSLRQFAMVPVMVFLMVVLFGMNTMRYPYQTLTIQSPGVVDTFYKIIREYEKDSWTLVSDVQEYAMCLGYGYHYEWTDLLKELSSGVTDINLPTKYIFFAIEKRPLKYGTMINVGEELPVMDLVTDEDAAEGFNYTGNDMPYRNQRRQVMAKAYYWSKAYQKLFPEEMEVYYEDENVIWYRLTQEMYYLNNLKIDYGYNSLKPMTEQPDEADG